MILLIVKMDPSECCALIFFVCYYNEHDVRHRGLSGCSYFVELLQKNVDFAVDESKMQRTLSHLNGHNETFSFASFFAFMKMCSFDKMIRDIACDIEISEYGITPDTPRTPAVGLCLFPLYDRDNDGILSSQELRGLASELESQKIDPAPLIRFAEEHERASRSDVRKVLSTTT